MAQERLYFIDRLRLLAVLILIMYHTGLIFALSNFPIKNNEVSAMIEEVLFFFHGWRLTLLFFLSGVGTSIALQYRNKGTFVKERFSRLFVPLLFGILVVVPPQIYVERLAQGYEFESFLSFYIQSFSTGLYPYGNISWNHLWFVAYLLIYSVLSIPLLYSIKRGSSNLLDTLSRKGGVVGWGIMFAVIAALLRPISTGVQNIVNDLSMFTFYWLVFVGGFTIHCRNYWQQIEKWTVYLLVAALILTCVSYTFRWNYSGLHEGPILFWYSLMKGMSAWAWVLSLVALAKRYWNRQGRYLTMLNESVYPLYILHQTVIICTGYFVVQQPWTIFNKFAVITATTIIICWLLFAVLRQSLITRILFGIKASKSTGKVATAVV